MKNRDDDVLNQNTLRIKYEGLTPYLEIHIEPALFMNFQTDHKLELLTSFLPDTSLQLTIRLKSFRSTIHFNTIFPSWDKHDTTMRKFLSSFISLEKTAVKIKALYQYQSQAKTISIPSIVREACKVYLGELLTFEEGDGLEDSFRQIPNGFLVPYANPSYFSLLCKVEDTFFEKIKFVPSESITFNISTIETFIQLSISYQGISFALILIKKQDICEDILEDFQILLTHQKLNFAITSESMNQHQYLNFSKELTKEQLDTIHHFFFSDDRLCEEYPS